MSTVHLSTPAAPRSAVCGDADATKFTPWRWKATCSTCKMVSAPRALDAPQRADGTYRTDLPVRYSALVAFVRHAVPLPNVDEALAEFERERRIAARCTRCGPIEDPIALFDVAANRMVFACPSCTTGPLRERWEEGC